MSSKKAKRSGPRPRPARGNIPDPMIGAAMSGTSAETSTEASTDIPAPETASSHEGGTNGVAAPSETTASPDNPNGATAGAADPSETIGNPDEPPDPDEGALNGVAMPNDSPPSRPHVDLPLSETAHPPEDTTPSIAPHPPEDTTPSIPPPPPLPSMKPQTGLRLRMKVWTDPNTHKRYLMPMGFMRDLVNGQPVTNVMYAYAKGADDTRLIVLTAHEWNALPFFHFQEDGHAP